MNMEVPAEGSLCVLLVDDHPLVLEGVRALLRPDAGVCVVAAVTTGAEALQQLRQLRQLRRVDVALLDMQMPLMSGTELVRLVRLEFPHVRLLALSMAYDAASVREVLDAGAAGYLLKNTLGPELCTAIRRVAAGHSYFCPEVAAMLLDQWPLHVRQAHNQPALLTPRELEILHLIAQEKSNLDIAAQLFISERTVETHRKNIFTKTGCKSVVGLLQYALRHKLLTL